MADYLYKTIMMFMIFADFLFLIYIVLVFMHNATN